ncbi:cytosolic 5'-nucleotidase 1A-like isoform X1 [Dendronephthya gigantea]|uniref:cytosolic 5'-nucleotidase 1A-like isoform X1 n=1 Tax=Dendronephthya gigantea TaxID=151771 RepID=UPI00106CA0BD|nr:cytosolic 5'-nucleotidase 1A-like isoform X1 [Dendronephthya gigantea]
MFLSTPRDYSFLSSDFIIHGSIVQFRYILFHVVYIFLLKQLLANEAKMMTREKRKSDQSRKNNTTSPEPGNKKCRKIDDEKTNDKHNESDEVQLQVPTQVPTTPNQATNSVADRPHGRDPTKTINIAVSSRALFGLDEEHKTFVDKGLHEYIKMQVNKEDECLEPGSAFPFIKALKNVNDALKRRDHAEEELFTVTLMSKNSAQVGIRLQKSIENYPELKIERMALTGGTSPTNYLKALNITLFLTSEEEDVKEALRQGFPSAVMSTQVTNTTSETQLRVAFDLDAVLFSDESERIYKEYGLGAFLAHEKKNKEKPLDEGPIKPFAMALGKMRKKFEPSEQDCPIRTFLVTSRDAEVGERALKTLRHWGLKIDESFFMAGAPKGEILKAINPHIYFDDQQSHIKSAREKGTPSGHVPSTDQQTYDKTKQESVKTNLKF